MATDTRVTSVHITAVGLSRRWLNGLMNDVVAADEAATFSLYERRHPDSGTGLLAIVHTQPRHVEAITKRVGFKGEVRAWPLDCAESYQEWIIRETGGAE